MSEEGIYNDIFHYLKFNHLVESDKKFYLFDVKTGFSQEYKAQSCLIPDPAIDSNFKSIFSNKSKRFENFLNSVYFIPKDMEISDIEYLVGDFNAIGEKYGLNCLHADIACKGTLKQKNKKNTKETLLDVEIQINWLEDMDDKLFEYGSLLRNDYSNKINEERIHKKKDEKDNQIEENEENEEDEEDEEDNKKSEEKKKKLITKEFI